MRAIVRTRAAIPRQCSAFLSARPAAVDVDEERPELRVGCQERALEAVHEVLRPIGVPSKYTTRRAR